MVPQHTEILIDLESNSLKDFATILALPRQAGWAEKKEVYEFSKGQFNALIPQDVPLDERVALIRNLGQRVPQLA